MKKVLLHECTVEELAEIIGEVVDKKIREYVKKEDEELMTRNDVCKFLDISLPTLHKWVSQGFITSYKVGSRVRFKRSEVVESLTKRTEVQNADPNIVDTI